ncbi:type 4a pilus biogenesis protein PilO [Endozoicomonas ascidiicola]|uniref:type 4a pilus biogenesis protein PilO n=1 Tax=Endozoicomonas ascidiicola TaxID=1698521 RepID=UPI00082D7A56|nr:type 4a pilus biogenesis protein PilO [Endozoicomonas ascidiicola]
MSLTDSFKNLNELDLSEIDFENIGSWPLAVRVIACGLTLAVVLGAGVYFHLTDLQSRYDMAANKEQELREQYRLKDFQAANLDAYREQMKEMEKSFGALVKQLPSDTEVPGLLEDITFTGRGAGLQIEEIKLQAENVQQFYIELPISIAVRGNYHDLGNFVSGVASLSRIVTLHDFDIRPGQSGELTMNILAKTYRYNDEGGL